MLPLQFTGTAQQAIDSLVEILGEYPRVNVVARKSDSLHVTFTSLLCRFVDDVEFEADTEHQLLHFRSASRLGYHDLGVNRKRMQQITQDLLQLDRFSLPKES